MNRHIYLSEARLGTVSFATGGCLGDIGAEAIKNRCLTRYIFAKVSQWIPPVQVMIAGGLATPANYARLCHLQFVISVHNGIKLGSTRG